MTAQNTNVKRGEVIAFATGEYSDFSYEEIIVASQDFDLREQAFNYAEAVITKEFEENGDFDYNMLYTEGLITHLVANNLAVPLPFRVIHLASYSMFNSDIVPEKLQCEVAWLEGTDKNPEKKQELLDLINELRNELTRKPNDD